MVFITSRHVTLEVSLLCCASISSTNAFLARSPHLHLEGLLFSSRPAWRSAITSSFCFATLDKKSR